MVWMVCCMGRMGHEWAMCIKMCGAPWLSLEYVHLRVDGLHRLLPPRVSAETELKACSNSQESRVQSQEKNCRFVVCCLLFFCSALAPLTITPKRHKQPSPESVVTADAHCHGALVVSAFAPCQSILSETDVAPTCSSSSWW